jgi:hypothetical protein
MASLGFSFLFYFIVSAVYAFTVYNDQFSGEGFEKAGLALPPFGGRWKYLTFANMVFIFFQIINFIFVLKM